MGGSKIDISGLSLTSLPSELNEFTLLESLNVSNNNLTSLSGISNFSNLTELIVSNNKISMLPVEFKQLKSLETL